MPVLTMPAPSEKQKQFLLADKKYVGFGGARGGGKSFAVRMKAVLLCLNYPGIKCMIVRKTYPELQENHVNPMISLLNCYAPNKKDRIASYNDSKKVITFPNKSKILFRYLDTPKDAERYQGTEVDILFVDECTHQTEENMKKLTACVRGVNNYPKRIYLTANPGSVGHAWFKRLFIDKQYKRGEKAEEYMFIKSLVTDNKALMEAQPDYIEQLMALPPKLREMWLEGNWNVAEGMFFEEFRDDPDHYLDRQNTHVIEPFEIPDDWTIYRSYDHGYSKPFSVCWFAYDGEIMYHILELYGTQVSKDGEVIPNTGVKWTTKQIFDEVKRIESEHRWLKGKHIIGIADPAIWQEEGGESIVNTANKCGVYFTKGDNARIPGWMQCHYRLYMEDGYPLFYVFKNCKNFIRTIPQLMYDEHKVEDCDTSMEDHCLAADTMVLTDEGYKRIDSLVGTDGYVLSHDGEYHKFFDARMTRRKADIFEIELEDGTKIKCTDDHRFMLPNGEWIHTRNLSAGMEVMTIGSTGNQQNCSEV